MDVTQAVILCKRKQAYAVQYVSEEEAWEADHAPLTSAEPHLHGATPLGCRAVESRLNLSEWSIGRSYATLAETHANEEITRRRSTPG
jgi:hypothetical protein